MKTASTNSSSGFIFGGAYCRKNFCLRLGGAGLFSGGRIFLARGGGGGGVSIRILRYLRVFESQ